MRNTIAKTALIIGILVAFTGTIALAENVDTDRFHVDFPDWCGKVAKKEQDVDSPSGPIHQVTYVGKATSGAACIVTFSELKATINDPSAMMQSGRDSLIGSLKAKLESEKNLTIAGQPGMSILYSATEPRPIFARTDLIVRDHRMYQLIFLGYTQEQRQQAEASSFFSSFRLKPMPVETSKKTQAPTGTSE